MSSTRPKVWEDSDGTPTLVRLTEGVVALDRKRNEVPVPAGSLCWVICPDPDAPGAFTLETCDTERPCPQVLPEQWEYIDNNASTEAQEDEQ